MQKINHMPKFSHTTTNKKQIAANTALDDMIHWQNKLDASKSHKQREYYRSKLDAATILYNKAKQKAI